jgi:hypothetical protein
MKLIGFLAFSFAGMTVINRWMNGQWITAADNAVMNNLTITHSMNVFGLFSVPVPNVSFFLTGLPRLVKWDYSFFGGNAEIIQFMLYALTVMVAFVLFTLIIGLLYQFFSRLRI